MKYLGRFITIVVAAVILGSGGYGYYVMKLKQAHARERLIVPGEKLLSLDKESVNAGRPTVLIALGSFSPITDAHVRMLEIARDHLKTVRPDLHVVGGFMSPVGDAYGKKGLAPAEHRIAMARLAVEDSAWLTVDPWESQQPTHQRAVVVLQHMRDAVNAHYGIDNIRVMLVCGADLVATFNKPGLWAAEDLAQLTGDDFGIIIVPRQGIKIDEVLWANDPIWKNQRNIFIVSQPIEESMSSTLIRTMVRRSMSIKYLVPAAVADYIEKHNLYKQPDVEKK